MKREVLSLKSIYKFLTLNDYPVYSEGIIKKDNRIGLTLNKFCSENILVDFKNRKTGKIIWRTEGSRNRYISEICNRSERLSIYKEYAEEVLLAADYFYNAIEERKSVEGQGVMVDTFCCGWILTMFTIHALMGNGEGEEHLHKIRIDKNYTLLEMLNRYQKASEAQRGEVSFLTGSNTELSCPPLKPGHFFGREVEMFELREMLMRGGAYLISGMGGSGKTELMRQFLKICVEEALVDHIYMSLDGYDFEKHRILNNMSVMYLDREMPECALEYLPEAYERGKVLGGLAFGETANNMSKAYRALGNREKELEYLKETAPILEQFYGSEHPKVVDAKSRLEE